MAVSKAEEWDGHRAVRDLVEKTPELRDLYRRLGYSPHLHEKCRKLLAQLNELEVTIPDLSQFQDSLDSALETIERHARGEEDIDPFFFADRELFSRAVNARASQEEVIRLLNEDFRKQLPISLEVSAIARRPRNPDAFAGALSGLDHLLRERWLPQSQDVRDELLEAVSEVRQELDREHGSVLSALESLERKLEDTVFNIADEEADEKKRSLDEVLWSFVYARHEYKPHDPYFIDGVAQEARAYLDCSWMHTKWLTVFILRHFLDGEVARQVPAELSQKALLWSAVAIGLLSYLKLWAFAFLWTVALLYYITSTILRTYKTRPLIACRQEVASGNYDGPEVARRLRDLERRGAFVHSLILRLLELHRA